VHVEACSNEASAAAMLGASIHYPLRGAVTWKSIVGTNVAADALSNLSSPGVTGGALIVVGEDYGEGASVIQERTHAYALKSSMLMLDPRPELSTMVRMVEEGFRLSETSNMAGPDGTAHSYLSRARQLRVQGQRRAGHLDPSPDGRTGKVRLHPAGASAGDVPPRKAEGGGARIPAARRYIAEQHLNELFPGRRDDVGFHRAGRAV